VTTTQSFRPVRRRSPILRNYRWWRWWGYPKIQPASYRWLNISGAWLPHCAVNPAARRFWGKVLRGLRDIPFRWSRDIFRK